MKALQIFLFISILINLRQCSDSISFAEEKESLEYEILELEDELKKSSSENYKLERDIDNIKQEKSESNVPVIFKKRKNIPKIVDSIPDAINSNPFIDSI